MNTPKMLHAKTTLEYLVLVNEQSYSAIGRELHITPQQFSDWIKKRRPIPQERLKALSDYFDIDESYLVDEHNFTRNLDPMNKIDIQMVLIKKTIDEGVEDKESYLERIQKLQKEKAKQIRIGRLASILHYDDEEIDRGIDQFLKEMEARIKEKRIPDTDTDSHGGAQ
ncbi:helix-turn-helix domain-containing protein [Paenibacillus hexagrammi]|uniref:Helix-turn-helix domain-containing protein n=1 Tax=Paenibacillus hexagrammi TaxID=2908839 RepID=A0ABY3SIA7_9BACL|nr:helix-turn-helix domain-containing protein [Paenibacillus sp. YPD9-1]UJF32860.1 helix-turn-helix domain-containing protein [Paenibacillus sp. YPD9-1]